MKLYLLEDFNQGISAIVNDDNGSYICDAEILEIKTVKNSRRFDFCHVTAKAEIGNKEIVLEGNFYL